MTRENGEKQSQTEQIMKESEERTEDPATEDLEDDSVERRKSDDLTSDAEAEQE
ncbi:MAG: hypothetical protein ABIS18_06930 [Actinomycetota bacterium]